MDRTWDLWRLFKCGKANKRTESEIKIGRATRDGEMHRGMFKQMMDRQPQKVRIPMPKF